MKKALFLVAFVWSQLALASDLTPELRAVVDEDLYKPHIGVSAGMSTPEGSFGVGDVYSLEFGMQPYIPFSYSVKATYGDYHDGSTNFNRTSLILEGKYNFGGQIPVIRHSYVGLGIGPAWESGSLSDGLALAAYPQVGFDIPLKEMLEQPISLGMNANYFVSSRTTPDTFNLTGVVKYWY